MKKIITILSATCLLTVFFISAGAQFTYAAYQQKAKSPKGVYLKNALTQIESKYGVNFIYIDKIVVDKKVQNLILSNSLETDLKKLLTPFGLSFKKISDKQITIYENAKKEAEEKTTTAAAETKMVIAELAADRVIKGKVYASADETPLEGATVTIKGTNRGTTTNSRGEFEINADNNEVLAINFVGYEGYEVTIRNQQSVNISLISTSKNMENVTVIGSRANVVRTNVERPVPVDVF
nr:carboxypeptidase-like regulatory domain-containing protein [Segetibacter sp.]